jgi:hypothetical protein
MACVESWKDAAGGTSPNSFACAVLSVCYRRSWMPVELIPTADLEPGVRLAAFADLVAL